MFPLLFVLAVGLILFTIIRNLRQWNRNNHAPRLTVDAVVAAKRTDVRHHHYSGPNGTSHTAISTDCFVTFQTAGGERLELVVSGRLYGQLAEGDRGRLTFQGTRYLDFARS